MNTCDSCKFWTNDASEYDIRDDRGNHRGSCKSTKFVDSNNWVFPRLPVDGLIYWDYEGYGCGFATGAKFGCIHWEKK